jgi:4-alpha-glucanotransferase
VTSLPDGRLGPSAYAWVDWLAEAGQTWWQVLPLGPPDKHRSPYKSASAFAAWKGFLADPRAEVAPEEIDAFREREAFWAPGWEKFAGPGALADQVRFEREWGALRAYAGERGVRLMGDVPIYVAPRSADHLGWPELFRGGEQAGCPPDVYSDDGQLWGNPLYDWPALQRRGYRWWVERLRRTFACFDMTRIDHFRGFTAYWVVDGRARTAAGGRWRRGPGRAPFDAARRALGELPVIAEDLGDITPAVTRLRESLGFPGMVVLQFAFDGDSRGTHEPHNHREDSVAYAGTHDSDTLRGWWDSLAPIKQARAQEAMRVAGVEDEDPVWGMIRLTFSSPARMAMIQAQDIIGLGSVGRMNMPGRAAGNWGWKLGPEDLTAERAARLRAATEESGRR